MSLSDNILTTSGSFDITTANGKIYTVTDTLTLDISDYEDGDYNVYVNPVDLTLSIKSHTLTAGSTFPSNAATGDYLLNTSKVPYDLQEITITTTTDEETGEETTTTTITKGLNEVYAGVLILSGGGNLVLNSFNSEILKLNEIGEPEISLTGKLNENEIWLEGAEVSKSAYPLLYLIYGDTYGTPEDENNFVLPDFRNRVIQGSDEFGYIEAGLPNLYGSHRGVYYSADTSNIGAIGVFSWQSSTTTAQDVTDPVREGKVYFDASSYNSIYGNSSTVQPPAIKVRVKTRYKL